MLWTVRFGLLSNYRGIRGEGSLEGRQLEGGKGGGGGPDITVDDLQLRGVCMCVPGLGRYCVGRQAGIEYIKSKKV